MQAIALAFLAATAVGGLAWVLSIFAVGEKKGRVSPSVRREGGYPPPPVRPTRASARAVNRSKGR